MHYCIINQFIMPDNTMLDYVFGYYDKYQALYTHLVKSFIHYLIEVHHLCPTQEMRDIANERGDEEMMAILNPQNNDAEHVVSMRL